MSHWNHRVIRYAKTHPNNEIEYWYQVHECYYKNDKSLPYMWTTDAIDVVGDSITELGETLERIQRCLQKPILHIVTDANGKERLEEL